VLEIRVVREKQRAFFLFYEKVMVVQLSYSKQLSNRELEWDCNITYEYLLLTWVWRRETLDS
jgi:hypothetical protein